MNKLGIFFLTLLLLNADLIHGQPVQFKKYTNDVYKFSFNIPTVWEIKYSKVQEGFICVPATKAEKEKYEDCFEGIVFRMEFYKSNLDSALLSDGDGLYTKIGDAYYTSDRFRDSIETKKIKGKNWTGIYHNNTCGISCKDNDFHAAAGNCEFLYFSNDMTTIGINTSGRKFDIAILKRLISSFHFE